MSWHDHCIGYAPVNMKNRYAFVDGFGQWNRVKYGSNFDDVYWIVSDNTLPESQLEVIIDKLGVRRGIDELIDQKHSVRFGKQVVWFRISW